MESMINNPFIKTKLSLNTVDSTANKYAIAQFVSEIAVVAIGEEAQLDPNRQYPGSDYDANCRKIIDLLIQAKRLNPSIVNHPYVSIAKRIMHITGDLNEKICAYAEGNSFPEFINIEEYLNLICDKDVNGNVIRLKPVLTQKDVIGNFMFDKDKKDKLSAAFSEFFANLDSVTTYAKKNPLTKDKK